MSATCRQIIEAMEKYAPQCLREEGDNVGLLAGSTERVVRKVLVMLEVTDMTVEEAVAVGADMIVAHHPIIRKGVSRITDADAGGRRLLKLIQNGVAVYAAHTNLDSAEGGVNDVLFDLLALSSKEPLLPPKDGFSYGLGRIGDLSEAMPLGQFADFVKNALGAPFVTYCGDASAMVRRVAVLGGGGAKAEIFALAAQKGCQAYVTGDLTHHMAHEACDCSLGVIDASHYYTEAVANRAIVDVLRRHCAENGLNVAICMSKTDGQVIKLA